MRLVVALLVVGIASSSDLLATPLVKTVAKNQHVEITLRGHSQSGATRQAYVTSLPDRGYLYQLSQPYREHKRHPMYVESGRITAASLASPVAVESGANKLIYVPPTDEAEPNGEWTRFTYKVYAPASRAWSPLGTVVVVPSAKTMVASDFSLNDESWVVRGGSSTADIQHESSRSGSLSYFVHHTDDSIDIRSGDTSDSKLWKFCAPLKYLRNFEGAYKGKLEYTLRSFSGNFNKLNSNRKSVVLQCSTCNQNKGMTIIQRDLEWDGSEKHFSITLSEDGGWLKDPKNTNKAWASPSDCEMVEMLSSLSEVCILGDYTVWYESVGLDNVGITAHAASVAPVPLKCQCANPGTQCVS